MDHLTYIRTWLLQTSEVMAKMAMTIPTSTAGDQMTLDDFATPEPCPLCVEAGRTGVLVPNRHSKGRGPRVVCSLRDRRKVGEKWVEQGACTYAVWEDD